jgi:4-hydroxy-3-methylbut-2-en-1-yl diphosphate synthase IspG/GcpE
MTSQILISESLMSAVMAESAISDKETRFNLAVMVGSAMYHAERLADAKFEKFKISKKKDYEHTSNFRMLEPLKCSFKCPIRVDR